MCHSTRRMDKQTMICSQDKIILKKEKFIIDNCKIYLNLPDINLIATNEKKTVLPEGDKILAS